jgi:formylglycine-generating enzyme required for sulfatase activity
LSNGQGNGDTETGAYTLTPTGIAYNTVTRNAGWTWAVTSEDEWYKAAYSKGGSTSGGYWDYPTSSDSINTGMANYDSSVGHTTDVGIYGNASPYGTFDQGGNVWEWNEAVHSGSTRGLRGGSFINTFSAGYLHASFLYGNTPSYELSNFGFRVSAVPEPSTVAMLGLAGLGILRWKKA